MLFVPKKCLVR